jgi:hypothetical protein
LNKSRTYLSQRRFARDPSLLFCLAAFLVGCTSPKDSGVKVIVGARLETGANKTPIEYSVVVIADGKIRAAGTQAAVPVPKGSEITSGMGMTIEPVPGGDPIEAGRPANLVLRGTTVRMMRNGEWVP